MILLLVLPGLAATLTVGSSGYSDLPAAIADASDGDTISVEAGTWVGCADLGGKDLTLLGAGADSTVLVGDGSCDSALVLSSGEDATIEDLTVTNTAGRGVEIAGGVVTLTRVAIRDSGDLSLDGGGISVSGAVVTLQDCTLADNTGVSGGHVYLSESILQISGGTYSGGVASGLGGAVGAGDTTTGSTVEITGATFTGNQASYGGALSLIGDHTLSSADTLWEDNVATYGSGGAMLMETVTASVSGDTFQDNQAALGATTFPALPVGYGGAIFATHAVSLAITDVVFDGNDAETDGGALAVNWGDEVIVSDCTFTDQRSVERGGAVALNAVVSAEITGATFRGNTSVQGGALFLIDSAAIWLSDSVFNKWPHLLWPLFLLSVVYLVIVTAVVARLLCSPNTNVVTENE